jgi:hypothetical protein
VTADHLKFKDGDILICDASDAAIQGGLTSAAQLHAFLDAGAEMYSYEGLHSKVAVFDSSVIIGSANLSANAGIGTCEANLLTDDLQIVALALGFIEKVRRDAVSITPDYVRRIEELPVTPRRAISRQHRAKITVGPSRVWFVSTRELSDRITSTEAVFEKAGMEEAKRLSRFERSEIEAIRWAGKSKFRSEAKAGDVVIQAFTYFSGKRAVTEVYSPAAIIHPQKYPKWTRFYLEYPRDWGTYRWQDVEKDFHSLGVRNISRGSTRELASKALGILQLLD